MLTTSVFAASADSYGTYQSAIKKMEKVKSAKIRGSMTIKIYNDLVSMDMKLPFTIWQREDANGNIEMAMVVDDNEFGVQSATYYKDGYMYTNDDGTKTRKKVPGQEAIITMSDELSKDLFQDATVETVEGGERIKVKIPSKYIDELMGGAMTSLADQSDAGSDVKLSSITCYYTIGEDGYLKSQQMSYTMTMRESGAEMKAKCTLSLKYSSLNNVYKIEFPSDLGSYKTVKS